MVSSFNAAASSAKVKAKGCTLIDERPRPRFCPDAAESLAGRLPDRCPCPKLALIVQPLEWGKQMVGPRHVESGAVVPHEISAYAVGLRQGTKFNAGAGAFWR